MSSLYSKAFFTLFILLASSFQSAYSIPVIKPNVNAIHIATTQGLRAARPYIHPLGKPIDDFNELQARTDSHSGHDSDGETGSNSGAEQQNHAVHHPTAQQAPEHHPPAQHQPAQQPPAQQPPAPQPQSHPTANSVRLPRIRGLTLSLGNRIHYNSAATASTSNLNQHGGASAPSSSGAQAIAPQQHQSSQAHSGAAGPSNIALPVNLHHLMLPAPPGLPQGAPPVNGPHYRGVRVHNQVGYPYALPAIQGGPLPPPIGAPQHGQPGQMGYVPAQPPMQVPHQQFVPDLGYGSFLFDQPHRSHTGGGPNHPASQGDEAPPQSP